MAARSMWNVNENEQQLLYDTQRRSHTEMAHTLADGNICLITKQLEQFKERENREKSERLTDITYIYNFIMWLE